MKYYDKRSFDFVSRANNLLGRIDSCPDEESTINVIHDELLGVFRLSAYAALDTKNAFVLDHHPMNVFDGLVKAGHAEDK